MIHYNPGHWSVAFVCSLKGSVFPKAFVWAASSSLLAVVLHCIVAESTDAVSALKGVGDVGSNVLSGFTFIVGFVIVFRSQHSYSRWWEGGTLILQLRGEWLNAAGSLLAFTSTEEEKRPQVLKFQHQIVRLISLLYASALQQICTVEDQCFWLLDMTGFNPESFEFLQSEACHDHCEVVLQWIQKLVVLAERDGTLNVAPPILSRVFNQLGDGMVNVNNVRKISEFPIPFPMAQMITVMLGIQWVMLPVICATTIKTVWWAGFLTFIIIFSFWSINYIATELEMPFGDDPSDLPLHEMQNDLNASLITLMHERAIHPPEFQFNDKVHPALAQVKVSPHLSDCFLIPIPDSHHHQGALAALHWFHHESRVKRERTKARKYAPRRRRAKIELKKEAEFSSTASQSRGLSKQQDVATEHSSSENRQLESLTQEPLSAQTHGECGNQKSSMSDQEVNVIHRDSVHPVIMSSQDSSPGRDVGISPSQVGVSFLHADVHDVSEGNIASPGEGLADPSSAKSDACSRQVEQHHYHHHNHTVQMQRFDLSKCSAGQPLPFTNRVHECPGKASEACCLQFMRFGVEQASHCSTTDGAHRTDQRALA